MVLAATLALMPSCLSNDDDDQWASYKDAAITSFTLGKLNQYLHTTSSQGTDSVYKKTYEGSAYKFYIDQLNGTIYNPEPLPYGTDAAHVLATVVAKNGGIVAMKSLTSDSLRYFSSSDSLDFRQVRQLYVYSNDRTNYRKYDVHVNVKATEGDGLSWTEQPQPLTETIEGDAMRAVVVGGNIVAKGTTDLVSNGLTAWMLEGGNLLSSADGTTWNTVGSAAINSLIGATTTKLYALNTDGTLVASTDNGATWTEELLDSDAAFLPTLSTSFVSIPSRTNAQTAQLVLVGLRDASLFPDDPTACVWAKVDEQTEASENQPWFFYGTKTEKQYGLPRMSQLQAVAANGIILAIGRITGGKILSYISKDSGLTWQADSDYALPDGFAPAGAFALTADTDGNIYLIDGKTGKVWQGEALTNNE